MRMRNRAHWQPKERKEDIAQDIRDFVQKDDPKAAMLSLDKMTAVDLTALMLALRSINRRSAGPRPVEEK